MSPDRDWSSERIVEQYDSIAQLDIAVFVREVEGWLVLSAGEITPGRWWAEYERGTPLPD
jgi:hypothetical protein